MGNDMISLTEVEERLDDLDERVSALEDLVNEHGPEDVTGDDAREYLEKGETRTVIIKQTSEERDGEDALAYLDTGLVVFVDENGHQIEKYDKVKIRITHVKPSVAHAGAIAVIEDGAAT